ncbi:B-box zinc finger protein 25 [Camellia lanceoleosa]|uniref:B-box zinc finger protein 25 n=1 Tax=Camellia lanceoleosa TaxID=1840588 RepID=A0ACC0GX78_9ERIC|nr:B-box zinc finger protein 25 [Camellia lanceoleosa]
MREMCDVCEKAPATVICCADEAALCAKCDIEVHAANKLASKHQRLLLQSLSNKLPPCDICQEKASFIFCVEDRALFCRDCDEPIHSASRLFANHQRFLATGIRVALTSSCFSV